MPAQRIISVGTDPELLWLRNAALIQRGDCGTLLICYSLREPIRQMLADAFRKHCPEGRIVEITNQRMEKSDFADTFVYGVEGPEALIDAIRRN